MKRLLSCALSAAFFFSVTPLQAAEATTEIFKAEVFGRTVNIHLNDGLPPEDYGVVTRNTLIDVQGVQWFGWDVPNSYVTVSESSSPTAVKRKKRRWRAASPSCNGVSSPLCPSSKAHMPVVVRFTGGPQQTAVEIGLGPEGLQAEKLFVETQPSVLMRTWDASAGLTTVASARQLGDYEIREPEAADVISSNSRGLGVVAPVIGMEYIWATGNRGSNFLSCPITPKTGLPDLRSCDRFEELFEPTDMVVTRNNDGLLWTTGGMLYFNAIKQDARLSASKYAVTFDDAVPGDNNFIIPMPGGNGEMPGGNGDDLLVMLASSTTGRMYRCSYPMHTAAGVVTPMSCQELVIEYPGGSLVGMIHPQFETENTFVTAVDKTLIACNSTSALAYTCRNIATLDTPITALSASIGRRAELRRRAELDVLGLAERINFIVGLATPSPTHGSNIVSCSVFSDAADYGSRSVCRPAFQDGTSGPSSTAGVEELVVY